MEYPHVFGAPTERNCPESRYVVGISFKTQVPLTRGWIGSQPPDQLNCRKFCLFKAHLVSLYTVSMLSCVI